MFIYTIVRDICLRQRSLDNIQNEASLPDVFCWGQIFQDWKEYFICFRSYTELRACNVLR